MDRIINVKVGGNHLSKDSKNAGVRGEANVAKLRLSFDEGWNGYTKKVTFWNARGINPVGVTLLPHLAENDTTYIVPIPAEPMEEAGELTFVIEGTVDDKVQRSISDKLEVKDAPIAKNAGQPVPPTEDELTQLEGEIEKIKGDILDARANKEATEDYRDEAKQSANEAEQSATRAELAAGKTPYIGENMNWYAWDVSTNVFYDTGVKAQAGSTVYCGDNPPDNADVWVNPYSDDATCTPYIGANGNWYQWNGEAQSFVDSGFTSKGDKGDSPVKGVDYWTEDDKAEIKGYIDEETEILKADIEGIQEDIHNEAHFRGYVSTDADIEAIKATPNDFIYSAESGTVWVYDAENGWQETETQVPDQLTPASETTPLINGVASAGKEEAYARGDHRHPTDTTRLGVEEFNEFKTELEASLDNIITKYGLDGDIE